MLVLGFVGIVLANPIRTFERGLFSKLPARIPVAPSEITSYCLAGLIMAIARGCCFPSNWWFSALRLAWQNTPRSAITHQCCCRTRRKTCYLSVFKRKAAIAAQKSVDTALHPHRFFSSPCRQPSATLFDATRPPEPAGAVRERSAPPCPPPPRSGELPVSRATWNNRDYECAAAARRRIDGSNSLRRDDRRMVQFAGSSVRRAGALGKWVRSNSALIIEAIAHDNLFPPKP